MLPHSGSTFPIDGRAFETENGLVIARVTNNPEAGAGDRRTFKLEFSDGRKLKLVLSDASLEIDPDGSYRKRVFDTITQWLATPDGPESIGIV